MPAGRHPDLRGAGIFYDAGDIRFHGRDERVGVREIYEGRSSCPGGWSRSWPGRRPQRESGLDDRPPAFAATNQE
jgi:hypothetical protein